MLKRNVYPFFPQISTTSAQNVSFLLIIGLAMRSMTVNWPHIGWPFATAGFVPDPLGVLGIDSKYQPNVPTKPGALEWKQIYFQNPLCVLNSGGSAIKWLSSLVCPCEERHAGQNHPNKFVFTWLGFAVGGVRFVWHTSAVICSTSPWKQKVCSSACLEVFRLSVREDGRSDMKQHAEERLRNDWEISLLPFFLISVRFPDAGAFSDHIVSIAYSSYGQG